jgi:hypothetical protein
MDGPAPSFKDVAGAADPVARNVTVAINRSR